ncbi:MAG: hypothetical protein MHM6MM_004573 [Cercozoa sp. M6MM]
MLHFRAVALCVLVFLGFPSHTYGDCRASALEFRNGFVKRLQQRRCCTGVGGLVTNLIPLLCTVRRGRRCAQLACRYEPANVVQGPACIADVSGTGDMWATMAAPFCPEGCSESELKQQLVQATRQSGRVTDMAAIARISPDLFRTCFDGFGTLSRRRALGTVCNIRCVYSDTMHTYTFYFTASKVHIIGLGAAADKYASCRAN